MPSGLPSCLRPTSKPPNGINQVISKVWILPMDLPIVLSHITLNIIKALLNWVQNWVIGRQLTYPDPTIPAHIKYPLTLVYTTVIYYNNRIFPRPRIILREHPIFYPIFEYLSCNIALINQRFKMPINYIYR